MFPEEGPALRRSSFKALFYKNLPGATTSLPAGRMKDNALFQRLSYLYDAITVGMLAGHTIDLPNIYCQPIQGAIAYIGWDCLHLIGDGFTVAFYETQGGGCMEDRLLIAWTGDEALCEWLAAVETAYYPSDFPRLRSNLKSRKLIDCVRENRDRPITIAFPLGPRRMALERIHRRLRHAR